jgi:PAS domain S-box-containing protein
MAKSEQSGLPVPAGSWPEPRLRALQVEELYRLAPSATGFSYFGALVTLGILITQGDIGRGAVWFLWATAVTCYRCVCIVSYRRRNPDSDPAAWGRLLIAANFLAGVQWGVLGTLLFPATPGYLQLFALMVIICFVAGSVTAYAAVKGAHEALAIPATLPTAINLFLVQDGTHWFAGLTALFFCFAITYYAKKLNRHIERSFRLQIERDDLLALTALLNEKLQRENRDLAHRAAVRGISIEAARQRAGRLETLFENSPLPQLECDAAGIIVTCNRAAERLLGLRYEDIVGRAFAGFLAGPYAANKALAGAREALNVEVEVLDRKGVPHICTASFTPLPAREGIKSGFALILSGVTLPAEVK